MLHSDKKLLFLGLMGLVLVAPPGLNSVQALTLEKLASNVAPAKWLALKFPQANVDRGQTSSSGGGGVRQTTGGSCLAQGDLPFQLLIPAGSNQNDEFYNIAGKETYIYAYVPPQDGVTVLLQLENPVTKGKSQKTFTVPSQGGIVGFPVSLPAEAIKDDFYNVSLTVVCDQNNTNDNSNIELTVNYSPLDKSSDSDSSPLEKAEFYAEKGLWVDALNALAAIAKEEPEEWQEFLVSGGFEKWADAPVVNCCSLPASSMSVK
jgi:hypothetical protein